MTVGGLGVLHRNLTVEEQAAAVRADLQSKQSQLQTQIAIVKAQYEALGGDWTPFSGEWDHYLILNLAVGNPWTGDPSPTAPFQAEMKVDWVKAYSL